MGLHVQVYKSSRNGIVSDCTINGISSKAESLCLVNVDGPFDPSERAPAALLVAGNLPGTLKIVPAEKSPDDGWWASASGWLMFGGNYAATSDSRFSEACERLLGHRFYGAVPIHDRNEGK